MPTLLPGSGQDAGPHTSDVQVQMRTAKHPAERRASAHGLNFDPQHTFDTFVVGDNNNFAYAAALAVAQAPGQLYSPLFLHGGVGLGKTHLLQAIGQHLVAHNQEARVVHVSAESFTNEFIEGIQHQQLARFRKKYRPADVLLMDDIQFLASTERVQEEFFHTFNALHDRHKQVVLACDRPPNAVPNLEPRLVSRFEWGLVADLQPPEGEMRLAILRRKIQLMGLQLPEAVLEFLANRIRSNLRRLQGALIRVASYSVLTGKTLSLEAVESLLRELLDEEGRYTIDIALIQTKVADHFDVRLADMTSERRSENIAFPRQVAMYLSRQLTDNSLNDIGDAFGGRYHGTVLHACQVVKGRMEMDPNFRQVIGYLERKIRN